MGVQNWCPNLVSKIGVPKVQKKVEGREARIVIPMPEAINFVDGRRPKY
jgi:hypothetical protein